MDPLPCTTSSCENGGDGIDTDPIDVVLLEPEQRIRQEKAADFISPVVEDQRAPILMLPLPRIGMLVQSSAVEPGEPVFILRKMAGHPIENHSESRLMTAVDQKLEVFGRAVPARRREEAKDLVSPGSRERVLHHRQQFDMCEAEILHIRNEAVRRLAIRQKAVPLL